MGIRFLCPNGHKLNVKSELAGKRAICPDCGVKLVVPAVGMSPSESSLQNVRAISTPAAAAAAPIASSVAPTPNTATPPSTAPSSVATEQPVVWYVRPASGGQFGPLSGDEISAWIADQRVTADTYLWRPGWADWRMAGDAPPDLPSPLPPTTILAAALTDPPIAPSALELPVPAPQVSAQDPDSLVLNPEPDVPAPAAPTKSVPAIADDLPVLPAAVVRRRRQQTPLVVTMLLVFTIALLVLALIWVIRRNGSSPTAGPQSERIPIAVPTGRA